ncbi:hypothetical protein A0H81_14206 [Grifola frondosa]|uniref:Uncharacterized protein n=1 Tax=Grifola frondosa TaxID=5627 RepID=A0A1C7LMZ4_GRIFR|nr:hypothetical protein A0H81_14206 [Grifola frondosa]
MYVKSPVAFANCGIGSSRQCDTACTVATCEQSVQDDAVLEVIEPLNHLLTTRYNNSISTPITPGHPKVGWTWVNPTGHPILGDVPLAAFQPHWGRGCIAHRPDVNISDSSKAGLHDFVLLAGPDCNQNLAIAEVKTFWAYSDMDFLNIFSGVACTNQGFFNGWNVVGNQTITLLKQIWGELHFYCASWGFATNGRKFVIFAKSGRNTLVFSDIKDWIDPQLHQAMAGMQFAAMDGRVLEVPVGQRIHINVTPPGIQYDRHLISRLCITAQNPW